MSVVLGHETGIKLIIPTPISAFAKFFLHAADVEQKQTLIIGWRDHGFTTPLHQGFVSTKCITIKINFYRHLNIFIFIKENPGTCTFTDTVPKQ